MDTSEVVKYLCEGKESKVTFQHFLKLHHLHVNGSSQQKLVQLSKYCDSEKTGAVSGDAVVTGDGYEEMESVL